MDNDALLFDFVTELAAYLRGGRTPADLVDWEAEYALDDSVPEDLAKYFDRVALIAAEVADGIRPEQDLRALADEFLSPTVVEERWAVAASLEAATSSESTTSFKVLPEALLQQVA